MFRLSKGNQSRKNHKIINQTTKVSDNDAKLSTPAIQAQQHQEALIKQQQEQEQAAQLKEATNQLKQQKQLKEQAAGNNETEKVTIQIINEEIKEN